MRLFALLTVLAFLALANVHGHPLSSSDDGLIRKRLIFGGGDDDSAAKFPDPNDDPFYKVPSSVSSHAAGDVLASRPVNTTIESDSLDKSFQILYRTQDTQEKADATVGTIWTPKTPSSPAKVLSFQVFEDATQLDCAPSWAFVKDSDSKNTISASIDAPSYIKWALEQGFYVISPDHLGSKSTFIAGFAEGYAVLDGIRAAIKFNKLPTNAPTAMAGYSGGASSTAWAANLAGKYASELNIVGAVHGGTPVDTRGIYEFLVGGAFAGFAGAGLSGLTLAYPELKQYIDSIVTEQGKKDLEKVTSRNECLVSIVFDGAFKNYTEETTAADPLNSPIAKKVLARESLLSNVSSVGVNVPKFPTFQFHAQNDQIVPRDEHEQFIEQQCKAGAKIQYAVIPLADHISATAVSVSGGIKALGQIYNGTLDVSNCGVASSSQQTMIKPDSEEAKQLLGAQEVQRINSFNGMDTALGRITW